MPMSLKVMLKKFAHKGQITQEEYDALIKKLEGHDKEVRARVINEFADFLHRKAKENNGLRLDSETRSWTHACIYDYINEFRAEQLEGKYVNNKCIACCNYIDPYKIDNICYLCCKGLEDNYKPKGE